VNAGRFGAVAGTATAVVLLAATFALVLAGAVWLVRVVWGWVL